MNYGDMVASLAKRGEDILADMDEWDAHVMHMSLGICGEAGEIVDCVKKAIIYRRELDRVNAIEELGDLEFYMEGLRQALGVTRGEVLAYNVQKLSKRYGRQYSDEAAHERADKA